MPRLCRRELGCQIHCETIVQYRTGYTSYHVVTVLVIYTTCRTNIIYMKFLHRFLE